jgi:hypothetical protein
MRVLALSVAALVLMVAPSASAAIIDFSTGFGGPGGTVVIGANITGSGIFIDTVSISGAPVNNGVFDVEGAGVCGDVTGGCGILNFDRNANTISLVGSIPALGILAPINLLTGDLSGGVIVLVNNGTAGQLSLSGADTKARELLLAIGLDPLTGFAFFASEISANTTGGGSPYTATSTDILNTSVPEPGSLVLIGFGLAAVAAIQRRRNR